MNFCKYFFLHGDFLKAEAGNVDLRDGMSPLKFNTLDTPKARFHEKISLILVHFLHPV